ncbi:junctional adhesion molecule 2b isoform X2 [Channa argus]|uniref:junctional adhesion molecule 2b isoform X2 n=1 Tax=Channa argus TaxID=215402 RepID=UPI003522C989
MELNFLYTMNLMKVLALPLLLTLLHSPVCLSVTVSSSKPKVEVHEHTDAVLACEFRTEKDQNPRIEWKKKGKGVTFVYFNNKFTGSYAGRAKIEGATLTLHSVTQKDSGEYRCEVTASEDHVNLGEASVTLNVLVPPHVPSCEVPSSVFVGSGLELLCKDKLSVPPATYHWYKDNKALTATADSPYSIDTNKGTLKFKSVSKTDTGMYRCESSNNVGAPKSCVAQQLKVIEYPFKMAILIAGAGGFLILLLLCCICVCVCQRRGCCKTPSPITILLHLLPAISSTTNKLSLSWCEGGRLQLQTIQKYTKAGQRAGKLPDSLFAFGRLLTVFWDGHTYRHIKGKQRFCF